MEQNTLKKIERIYYIAQNAIVAEEKFHEKDIMHWKL